MSYPIIKVPKDASTQLEQLGTKAKFWYRDSSKQKVLFKEGRPGTGENWAEKVCCEICKLLKLPCAEYELAVWGDREGVVSPSLVPAKGALILGNELLAEEFPDIDQTKKYKLHQHTVEVVMSILDRMKVGLPLKWETPFQDANSSDVFVGYLMLDALVSNQDRHAENWGLVICEEGITLAPTFDHASSLGRNEKDSVRQERLSTKDKNRSIENYVNRARSALYKTPSSSKPLTTLDAYLEAAKLHPDAARRWQKRLSKIKKESFHHIFDQLPDKQISQFGSDFALKMIETNAIRILNIDSE